MSVRAPAVAGLFYSADAAHLRADVIGYLAQAAAGGTPPKAMILPHAGYLYSGPVAASGYALISEAHAVISRVVLLGPTHFVPLRGLAVSGVDSFATPLGRVPLDRAATDELLDLPQVTLSDAAHREEHSLEVHLPFLQQLLDSFSLVPLVVGDATADEVAEVLEHVWGGPETLIVISSDLSHYHDDASARLMDGETAAAIEALLSGPIDGDHACGCVAIRGMLRLARRKSLTARTLDLRNSGQTAGPQDRVVGYGAFAFDAAPDPVGRA